ncbi:MAG: histidine phosphatase family protein, partial [Myxococcota bacterium]
SSPLARARQTAAPLGGTCPIAVGVDEALVEIHMGELEGLSGADFAARWPEIAAAWRAEPHAVSLPGGERIAEVQARGVEAFARIARTVGPGETVVVVTHQILLATLVCHLRGSPICDFRTYMHRNTGVTTVELGETPRVVTFDDATHLEG